MTPSRLRYRLHEFALFLWRWMPLNRWLRWRAVALLSPRYIVGVHAVIRDEEGRLLLLYHPYRGKNPWGLPGGGLKRNEDPEQGVIREAREEIGVQVKPQRLIMIHKSENVSHLAILYECEIVTGEMKFGPEIRKARYFPPKALPSQISSWERGAIEEALALLEE